MSRARAHRNNFIPAVLLLSLLLTGCARTIQYPRFPDQTKTIEDPSKARLYVIRPAKFWGSMDSIRFTATGPSALGPRIGGFRIAGELGPASYLCWETAPGSMLIQKHEGN